MARRSKSAQADASVQAPAPAQPPAAPAPLERAHEAPVNPRGEPQAPAAPTRRCGQCEAFEPDQPARTWGRCKRNAPVPTGFPRLPSSEWCMQFVPAPPATGD